ncbi:MAG: F-box protein [Parachlamydia sp.]|nr:F-box protein [Parachlamydia sp.]
MLPLQSVSTTFHEPPAGREGAKKVLNIAELVLMIFSHLDVKALSRAAGVCKNWKDLAHYQQQFKIYRVVRTTNQLANELFNIYRNLDLNGMNAICCVSESNKESHVLIFFGNSTKLPSHLRGPGAGAYDPMGLFKHADYKYAILAKHAADFQQDPAMKTLTCRSQGSSTAKIELIFLNTIPSISNERCFKIDDILDVFSVP